MPAPHPALSPEKRLLFEKLLAKKGMAAPAGGGITPRRGNDPVELTSLQEGMWFIEQLNPGTATYNVPMAARLNGELNLPALHRALDEIVQRHESLRTTFPEMGGVPRQVILPPQSIPFPLLDVAGDEAQALRLATAEARAPFNLATELPIRAQLIRLTLTHHLLLITIHHIVTDGWSMGVLTRELIARYRHYTASTEPAPIAALPIQFGDYARWQRNWLKGETLANLLGFWRESLGGHSFALNLPLDHPRPPLQSGRGLHHTFTLPPELSDTLRQISQHQGVTLFAVLLAVFKALLSAWGGQDDIIVGTPIANRNRTELEGMIGYFVNLLPLRTKIGEQDRLGELARRVYQTTLEANAHQELPFGKLVEELQPARDASRNPIFQVEFTLLDPAHAPPVYGYGFRLPARQAIEFAGLTLTPLDIESEASKFDLTVLLWDMPGGISGTFEFNADLFETGTIISAAGHFEALLQQAAASPDITVAALKQVYAGRQREDTARQRQAKRDTGAKRIQTIRRKSVADKEN